MICATTHVFLAAVQKLSHGLQDMHLKRGARDHPNARESVRKLCFVSLLLTRARIERSSHDTFDSDRLLHLDSPLPVSA